MPRKGALVNDYHTVQLFVLLIHFKKQSSILENHHLPRPMLKKYFIIDFMYLPMKSHFWIFGCRFVAHLTISKFVHF